MLPCQEFPLLYRGLPRPRPTAGRGITYRVIEGKVNIHDLRTTMLHLLGIDTTQLTFNQVGRDFRLTDIHGSVVQEILA